MPNRLVPALGKAQERTAGRDFKDAERLTSDWVAEPWMAQRGAREQDVP